MSWKYEDNPRPELLPKLCDINDIEWLNENEKQDSSNNISLHKELIKFYNYIRLTKEEVQAREELITSIKSLVNNRWPHATINCFGSYQLHLSNFTSDIDISISGLVDNNIDCEWYIDTVGDKSIPSGINNKITNSNVSVYPYDQDRQVFDSLDNDDDDVKKRQITYYLNILYLKDIKNKDFVHRSEFRPKARVPIINFTTVNAIECDVSVGINKSNTNDVVYKIQSYKDITLFNVISNFLKLLLFLNDLNKPFHGGIGSFKLYMMIGQILTHKEIDQYLHSDYGLVLIYFFNFYRQWRNFNRDTTITLFNVTIDFRISQKVETCRKLFDRCWYLLDQSKRPINRTFHRAKTSSHLAMLLDVQILKYNRNISLSNLQISKRLANKVDYSLDRKSQSSARSEIVRITDIKKESSVDSKITNSFNTLNQKQLELIKNREIYSQIDSHLNEVVDMQVDTFVQSSNQLTNQLSNQLEENNNKLTVISTQVNLSLSCPVDNRVNTKPGVVVQQENQQIDKPTETQILKKVDIKNKQVDKAIDINPVEKVINKQIETRPLVFEKQSNIKNNKPNDKTVITNTTNYPATTNISAHTSNYIAKYSSNYNTNYSTNYVTNYLPICPTNCIPNYSSIYTPYYPSNYQTSQYNNNTSNYSANYLNMNYPIANSLSNTLTNYPVNYQSNQISTYPTNKSTSTNYSSIDRNINLHNMHPLSKQLNQSNLTSKSITNLSATQPSTNLGTTTYSNQFSNLITISSNNPTTTLTENSKKVISTISPNHFLTNQTTCAINIKNPIIDIPPYSTADSTNSSNNQSAYQTIKYSNNGLTINQTTNDASANAINIQADIQNKTIGSISQTSNLGSNLSTNSITTKLSNCLSNTLPSFIPFTNKTNNNQIMIQNTITTNSLSTNPSDNNNNNPTINPIHKISEDIIEKLPSNNSKCIANSEMLSHSNTKPSKDLSNNQSSNSQTVQLKQEIVISKADNLSTDNNTNVSNNVINQEKSDIFNNTSNNQFLKSIYPNPVIVEEKKSSEISTDISANLSKKLSTHTTANITPNTLVSKSQANNASTNTINILKLQSVKDLYNNKNNQKSNPLSNNLSHNQSNHSTFESSKVHISKPTPDSIRRYLEELQQSPSDVNNELYRQWIDYIKKVKKFKQKEFPQLSDYQIKYKAYEYIDKHIDRFSLYDMIDKKVKSKLRKEIYNKQISKMEIQIDSDLNNQKSNQIDKVMESQQENKLVKDIHSQIKPNAPVKRTNDNELYATNKKSRLVEIEYGELISDVDRMIVNRKDIINDKSIVTKVDSAIGREIDCNVKYGGGSSDSKIDRESSNKIDNLSNVNVVDNIVNKLDSKLLCKTDSEKVNKMDNRLILNEIENLVDSEVDVNTNTKIVNKISNITNRSIIKNSNDSINNSLDRQRYYQLENMHVQGNITSSMKQIDSNNYDDSYLDRYTNDNDGSYNKRVIDSHLKDELISNYLVNDFNHLNRYIINKVTNQWHRYINNLKLSITQNKAIYLTSYPNMTDQQIHKQVVEYILRNFYQLEINKIIITKVRRLVVRWLDTQVVKKFNKSIDSQLFSKNDIQLVDQLNKNVDKYTDVQIDRPFDKQIDNHIDNHLNKQIDIYIVIDKHINTAITDYVNDQLLNQSLADNKLKEIQILNDLIKLNKKENKLLYKLIDIKRLSL